MNLRSQREKESVDSTDIYQNSEQWHQNFAHVFQCSNSIRHEQTLKELFNFHVPGKRILIFMEPLGSNLLLRLYWQIAKNAHTQDERPFMRQDLNWLKNQFSSFTFMPINYFSLLFGILSSRLFTCPDNLLMKISDILDTKLARISFLKPNYRQAIFLINK